ncbi:MAG: preprotein translocase subunit YajC [Acidimicrobiales bacterium]
MTFVHVLPALLAHVHLLTSPHDLGILAKSSSKKSSSGSSAFLFILLILAVGAFLFMRPQRRRQKEQQAMQKAVSVGDEVITSSGIVGTVRAMNDDRVLVEIAPGTTVEIVRRAVGQRVPQAPSFPDDAVSAPPPAPDATDSDQAAPSFPSPSPKPDPDAEQTQTGEEKSG